jgi:hypothetical protein
MKALKDLGLDVTKGSVTTELDVIKTKFFIMRMLVPSFLVGAPFVYIYSIITFMISYI